MATTPTTLEASRYCDLMSLFPDHASELRDVEQAYLLAPMEGTATYIVLPKELWTPAMHSMRRPVVLLERALYGHPLAGPFWQKYCTMQCLSAGFRPFSDNWPCTYWNHTTCTILCVYVDDMKMAGDKKFLVTHWKALGEGIVLAVPKGDTDKVSTYLGCEHRRHFITVKEKR